MYGVQAFAHRGGYCKLFVGRNHKYCHLGTISTDVQSTVFWITRRGVARRVHFDAEHSESTADACPYISVVLADAGGEHDRIDMTEHGEIGADVLLRAVAVHVERKPCLRVSCIDEAMHFPHIRLATQALEAALEVEYAVALLTRHFGKLAKQPRDRRVEVAASRTHDEPLERCHAHRRVHTLPAPHCTGTRTVAEMQGDQVHLGKRPAEELGCTLSNVGVRGAVESVATNAVRAGELDRQSVLTRDRRQRMVKRRVEDRDMAHMRECGSGRLYAGNVCLHVYRRQQSKLSNPLQYIIVDSRGFQEARPTVDDSMPNGHDIVQLDRGRRGLQGVYDRLHPLNVIACGHCPDSSSLVRAGGFDPHRRFACPDAFYLATQERALGVHRKQLELHRTRSGVDDEDLHSSPKHAYRGNTDSFVVTQPRAFSGVVSYDGPMSTPIRATRLYMPPPRSSLVPRRRLIERLDEGLRCRLTLVSAGAGFGKTTLVSEWVAGCERVDPEVRPAWLSLDEGDGDPARFLTYLVAALQTVAKDVGAGVLEMLESLQPPSESILSTLLNEVAALPHGVVLVLDDYHTVESEPVDEMLTFLLEHLPPQLHVVIATREDPRLPLARWRARGQLSELRAADLRFTASEGAEFLNQVMRLDLATEDIAALEMRTEGWIVGLQLAALSMQGRSNAAGFIRAFTGSNRFVLDYLVEEVLQRQPPDERRFLLQTSILDTLCASLCDAVVGQKRSKEVLERLERDNLFLVPLDDERTWYRYHHLFGDVLRAHLLEEQPDQLPTLHRKASDWYEANGSRSDAIVHALRAEDFERATDLIELEGPSVKTGSQTAIWLGWARSLPDEVIRARPALSVWYAYALLGSGDLEAAEARLTDAERWLEPGQGQKADVEPDQLRSLLATIGVARAYRAHSLGDVPGTLKHAQRVLDLLPEDDHLRRDQAIALIGMTYWTSGDLESTDRLFHHYSQTQAAAGNLLVAISAISVLPDIRPALGRLREGIVALTELLQVVVDQGEPLPPEAADLYRGLGELILEQGDLPAAAAHLLRSKELGEQGEMPVWRWRWHVAQARLSEAQGDPQATLGLLNEAQRLFIRTPLPDARPLAALKARIWAAQGRVSEALEWARERGLAVDDELSYMREFEHVTFAKALIVSGVQGGGLDAIDDAIRLLERLLHAAEQNGRIGSAIEILALQARAHQVLGDTSAALVPLQRALTLAEPECYVLVFANEGPPMARLLQEAASRGVAPDSARRLLAAFRTTGPDAADASEVAGEHKRILSDRELEVLSLIATGLTNPEIAARLYLSLYTVKAHARSIYDKLDAHSRMQAVARARELGLLPLL